MKTQYLATEVVIIGSALVFIVALHLPVLRRQGRALALTTIPVTFNGGTLDAWPIANGRGCFSPALTSGIWLGSLLFEELTFWAGTAFVTAAATLVMAEALDRGIPWRALPLAIAFPSWLWLNVPGTTREVQR